MNLRILAIVLIGAALSMQASFAQDDAGAGAHDDAKAADRPAAQGADPAKLGNQSAPRGEKNDDAIDTSGGIQLHRPSAKQNKIGEIKSGVPAASKNPHRRAFSAQRLSNRTVRNSIGLPIERRDNGQSLSPAGSRAPATTAINAARAPGGSVAKIEGQIARPTTNAARPAASPATNRAVINGTAQVHRVPSSSGIGGPSAAAGGISGTSIRPKH